MVHVYFQYVDKFLETLIVNMRNTNLFYLVFQFYRLNLLLSSHLDDVDVLLMLLCDRQLD
jgi:hypothetical protein